jgi:C4-dicarboxylate transporter DctM subunit
MTAALMLFSSLALMLILGVPIAVSLGMSALITMVLGYDVSVSVLPQKIFSGINSTTLLSIPFFILAGNIMTEGGISKRIVDFCNRVIGGIRGGMAIALILACAFFAALSGSAPATVISVGMVMYTKMSDLGYPRGRVAGLLAVSGGLGPIIPPSIIMLVYCTITGATIGSMFKAGLMGGLILVVTLVVSVVIYSIKEQWPISEVKLDFSQIRTTFFHAFPALLLPVIILGGIYSGLMTAVEVSSASVIYALVVSCLIYKELKIGQLREIMVNSAKGTAMILFIVATSSVFTWIFTFSGVSKIIVSAITSFEVGTTAFMLAVAILVLVFGTFLEGTSICILLTPMLWLVAKALGINIIHFGMTMCMGIVIGTMTPPVAVNIFSACSVSKLNVGEVVRGELPFFAFFILVYFLIVLFPQLYLWAI